MKAENIEGFTRKKKNRISKKRRASFGVALSLYLMTVSFSAFFGLTGKVQAVTKVEEKISVFVDCVIVEKGDTLWEISERYHSAFYPDTRDYIIAIKECNNLQDDTIQPGFHLMIPYTERR